jgi:hypothetical protein
MDSDYEVALLRWCRDKYGGLKFPEIASTERNNLDKDEQTEFIQSLQHSFREQSEFRKEKTARII